MTTGDNKLNILSLIWHFKFSSLFITLPFKLNYTLSKSCVVENRKRTKNIYIVSLKYNWYFTLFCNVWLSFFFFAFLLIKKKVKQIDQWKIHNCNIFWGGMTSVQIVCHLCWFYLSGIAVQLGGRIPVKNSLREENPPCQNQSASCHKVAVASKQWITPTPFSDSSKFWVMKFISFSCVIPSTGTVLACTVWLSDMVRIWNRTSRARVTPCARRWSFFSQYPTHVSGVGTLIVPQKVWKQWM